MTIVVSANALVFGEEAYGDDLEAIQRAMLEECRRRGVAVVAGWLVEPGLAYGRLRFCRHCLRPFLYADGHQRYCRPACKQIARYHRRRARDQARRAAGTS